MTIDTIFDCLTESHSNFNILSKLKYIILMILLKKHGF